MAVTVLTPHCAIRIVCPRGLLLTGQSPLPLARASRSGPSRPSLVYPARPSFCRLRLCRLFLDPSPHVPARPPPRPILALPETGCLLHPRQRQGLGSVGTGTGRPDKAGSGAERFILCSRVPPSENVCCAAAVGLGSRELTGVSAAQGRQRWEPSGGLLALGHGRVVPFMAPGDVPGVTGLLLEEG